jgi:putative tricarboxylic transport membrane protein
MEEKISKAADVWSGLALAALGTYIVVEARRWEYLGPEGPGAGFFPLWYGIAMVVLSAALVVSSVLRKRSAKGDHMDWRGAGRALSAWLALVVAVAACKVLGFTLSFAALTFFIVAAMYRRPLAVAAAVAAVSAAAFHLLFAMALGVPLPVGVLGF